MNNAEQHRLVQLLSNLSNACKSLAASLEVLAGHDQDHGQQLANHSAQLLNQADLNAGFSTLLANQNVLLEMLAQKVGLDLETVAQQTGPGPGTVN